MLITKGVPENHASQFEANINPGTTYDFKSGERMAAISIFFMLFNVINIVKRRGMIWYA